MTTKTVPADDIRHALGTLAAASLGGPVAQKYVRDAIATLYRAGLVPRRELSADEAFRMAYDASR